VGRNYRKEERNERDGPVLGTSGRSCAWRSGAFPRGDVFPPTFFLPLHALSPASSQGCRGPSPLPTNRFLRHSLSVSSHASLYFSSSFFPSFLPSSLSSSLPGRPGKGHVQARHRTHNIPGACPPALLSLPSFSQPDSAWHGHDGEEGRRGEGRDVRGGWNRGREGGQKSLGPRRHLPSFFRAKTRQKFLEHRLGGATAAGV